MAAQPSWPRNCAGAAWDPTIFFVTGSSRRHQTVREPSAIAAGQV